MRGESAKSEDAAAAIRLRSKNIAKHGLAHWKSHADRQIRKGDGENLITAKRAMQLKLADKTTIEQQYTTETLCTFSP